MLSNEGIIISSVSLAKDNSESLAQCEAEMQFVTFPVMNEPSGYVLIQDSTLLK